MPFIEFDMATFVAGRKMIFIKLRGNFRVGNLVSKRKNAISFFDGVYSRELVRWKKFQQPINLCFDIVTILPKIHADTTNLNFDNLFEYCIKTCV